jgi:hypothetical protein
LRGVRWFAFFLGALLLVSTIGAAEKAPTELHGYITNIASTAQFSLDGNPIACDSKTRIGLESPDQTVHTDFDMKYLAVGDLVQVNLREGSGTPIADEVLTKVKTGKEDRSSKLRWRTVLLATQPVVTGGTVIVDGWPMRVTAASKIDYGSSKPGELPAGMQASYKAERKSDGSVELIELKLEGPSVTPQEQEWTKAQAYEIEPPDFEKHIDGKATLGKLTHADLPSDAEAKAAQERLQDIGEKLMPAWQRGLAEDDPAKLHVKFYVVKNGGNFRGGLRSPDGQILIAEETTKKMADPELAALLSIHLAALLAREDYQARKFRTMEKVLIFSEIAASPAAPLCGASAIAALATGNTKSAGGVYEIALFEADMRNGLYLMHAAGFDALGMPLAILKLGEKPEKFEKPGNLPPEGYSMAMGMWKRFVEAVHAASGSAPAAA